MTSCCLCLREERTVTFRREWYCKQDGTCRILRIVNFSFYISKLNFDKMNVSSIECINDYHNSSRIHHGTSLLVLSLIYRRCTSDLVYPRNSSYFLGSIYDWSSVLPKGIL